MNIYYIFIIGFILLVLLFITAICGVIVFGIVLKIYIKKTTGWCKNNICLVGKTIIITGADEGIGFETALEVAKRGARVILACQNEDSGEAACARIRDETNNRSVLMHLIDMASFDSVRSFAKTILSTERRLDVLINNPGVGGVVAQNRTKDGQDFVMETTFFSSFLLTNLLLDLLKKSGSARVVNVASMLAMCAVDINPKKLGTYPGIWNEEVYSKLCHILFTQELARKLEKTGVTTYSVHPGFLNVQIFKYVPKVFRIIIDFLRLQYLKSYVEGAQTTLYCATQKDIEKYSGDNFSDCKRIGPYWTAKDPNLAREIWDKTTTIVGLHQHC